MKIAVASNDKITVSEHFGRTRGFVIFEVENGAIKSFEYRDNTFIDHSMGKESTHSENPHERIINVLSDCKAVISRGMGRRLVGDLTAHALEAYITDEPDVNKAIELYLSGNLTNLIDSACDHSHENGESNCNH